MFYVIKNNNLYEYGDNVNRAWEYPAEAKELSGADVVTFEENRDKYAISDGLLVDISNTEEYLAAAAAKVKGTRISEIKEELNALDLKCIRALREGGNDEDGVPYIEKFQAEISELRAELSSLQ